MLAWLRANRSQIGAVLAVAALAAAPIACGDGGGSADNSGSGGDTILVEPPPAPEDTSGPDPAGGDVAPNANVNTDGDASPSEGGANGAPTPDEIRQQEDYPPGG